MTLTTITGQTGLNVTDSGATTATGLVTNNGGINFQSTGKATLGGFVANGGSIVVNDGNTTTVNGTGLSALTLGSGTISITSKGLATLSNLGAASGITISGKGGITATSIASDTGGITVTNTGAGIVTLTGLSTGTSGDITVTTGGKTTVDGLDSAGAISISGGNATTVGSMTATGSTGDGFISVLCTTGALATSANAQIYSQNDSILLENKNTKVGTIVIGTGSDIETGAKPNPGGTGGNIAITIGAPPTPAQSPPQQGLAPSPSVVTATTINGVIYWGTNGITAVLDGSGNGNVVTAKGANVIFNTGKLAATAITLEGDTTIIADPPVTAPLAATAVAAYSPTVATGSSAVVAGSPTQVQARAAQTPGNDDSFIRVAASPISFPISSPSSTGLEIGRSTYSPSLTSVTGDAAHDLASVTYTNANGTRTLVQQTETPASIWISETEIESGAIPAVISSDHELGIHNDVTSILEMNEVTREKTAISAAGKIKQSNNLPLEGGVTYFRHAAAKEVKLGKGSVVFAPNSATLVDTPFGQIELAPKSLVLVMAMKNGLAVYDMHDSYPGSVKIVAGGKQISLAPGRHALISNETDKGFEQVNAAQLFAYRGINRQTAGVNGNGAGMQVFTAEFNLLQAIGTVMPLKQLVTSSNPEARKIAQRLLKTAGIMAELTAGGEQYQQVLKPKMVAFNQ